MDFTTGLIETIYVLDKQIALKAYHKNRLENGLALYKIKMDATRIFDEIDKAVMRYAARSRELKVRFEIFPTPSASNMQINITDFSRADKQQVKIGFARGLTIDSLRSNNLKTTKRAIYDQALEQAKASGLDDMIICNEQGAIVETGIYNLLWRCHETGKWYTPPLHSGCVAGVQRRYLLDSGDLKEKDCYPKDLLLSPSLMVCNALRGVLAVEELAY